MLQVVPEGLDELPAEIITKPRAIRERCCELDDALVLRQLYQYGSPGGHLLPE